MKAVLVTGSRGFVGRALSARLAADGFSVVELPEGADIAEPSCLDFLGRAELAHVFHLAGKTYVPQSWEDPPAFYRVNVAGTASVLELCRRKSIPLTCVSAYLYGRPARLPISEADEVRPNNPYAHSKHLAEELCRFYAREMGVKAVIIRPFNVYGPSQDSRFLIPTIIRQALEGEEIKVMDLHPKRDYVYIDDLVGSLVLSMKRANDSGAAEAYNIGSGHSVSVQEVIDAVQSAVGTAKKVVSTGEPRKNEISDVVADISRAAGALGWAPATSFEDGIKKTVEAIMNEGRNIPINKGNYSMEPPEREARFEEFRGKGWEKEYAEYRRRWSENALKKVVADYPLLVDVELASICNLRCPMCYTITDEFKRKVNVRLMEFSLFKRIIDEIGGRVPALRLSLRGEPTLHPDMVSCVRYAKEKGIKEVSFLTNGSKLNAELFTRLVDAGTDWITISVDGLGEVYEGIRKPLKFSETLAKIRDMKRIKDGKGAVRPVVKVQSVWPAIKDDPQAYYRTFEPYSDLIAFNPLIDYLGKDEDIVYEEGFSCPQHYQRLVIGADGLVMMCSNDEENSVIVGDAKTDSVHSIWHGEKLSAIRELHRRKDGFKEMEVCRKCYLPRKTEDGERATVDGREFIVRNYVNRGQTVGE